MNSFCVIIVLVDPFQPVGTIKRAISHSTGWRTVNSTVIFTSKFASNVFKLYDINMDLHLVEHKL
jgi:hypothetical protein